MKTKEKILLFWSGGKDSALALYELTQSNEFEIIGLITIFDREKNRVPFHGIPDSLILEQAKLLKIPLQRIFLPHGANSEVYIKEVSKILSMYQKRGVQSIAFGDINLGADSDFKVKMLTSLDMKAIFPLSKYNTKETVDLFLKTGHKALVSSVLKEKLGYNFLACEFNEDFLNRLPKEIDPSGENGEFHTFVTYGPNFKMRVPFSKSIAVEEGPYLVSLIKEP